MSLIIIGILYIIITHNYLYSSARRANMCGMNGSVGP